MRPALNLRQIEVFRAIMLTGSVSSAGRLLSISQPAVSRVLRQVEDRTHVQLFVRRATGLQPTPEAQRLFAEIERVYQGVQRVQSLAGSLARVKTGTLRLASVPSLGQSLAPRAVGAFHRAYPDVKVVIDLLLHRQIVEAVARGDFDLGISLTRGEHPNIASAPLGASRLVCVCPREHALASRREVSPGDMLEHAMVLQEEDTPVGAVIQQFLSHGHRPPQVACSVRVTGLACSLVQTGMGIAIVDEFSFDHAVWPGLVARPLRGDPYLRYHLLTSVHQPASVVTTTFVEMLRELVAEHAYDLLEPPISGAHDPRTNPHAPRKGRSSDHG
ncbi:LysR family transcriptional regulator [Roseomonas sp. OT10]|uniref:LysR family transcriptional regulator n=1 Tax=Roseomonas cutis TaxID=2897332 RepID=UPI001E30D383|nr:LysR family transcriptional regulator [Roseomonas sp. OT10]UFN48505.1 LysR family transcriptional regulator [Roseomonas sp. OT10]